MHPTVSMNYLGTWVEIDEEIAPLLQKMWDRGIQTYGSCQENKEHAGKIWIGLENVFSLLRFLDSTQPIHQGDVYSTQKESPDLWTVRLTLAGDGRPEGIPWAVYAWVSFPRKDLLSVEKLLE